MARSDPQPLCVHICRQGPGGAHEGFMRLRMQYADDASWQNIQPGQAFQDPLCFPPSLGEGGEETVLLLRSSYFGEVCVQRTVFRVARAAFSCPVFLVPRSLSLYQRTQKTKKKKKTGEFYRPSGRHGDCFLGASAK